METLDRWCLHTITTKPWSLEQAVKHYAQAGVRGITIWREHLEGLPVTDAVKLIGDSGMEIVSLCRCGFFPATHIEQYQSHLDENRRVIEQAATLGAPLIVLVCGADPQLRLPESCKQIQDAITTLLPEAQAAGVKLSIEPLHPMYADKRSAINTLKHANDIVEQINNPYLGVTVDVYHLWWDPDLQQQIARAGKSILSFHVCDWRIETRSLLYDRELMGEGCINVTEIRQWVEQAGFNGFIEVEIFSNEYWSWEQTKFLEKIKRAYLNHV